MNNNANFQDWNPVVIHNKKVAPHTAPQKPIGNKEFNRLDNEEIPMLNKITHKQAQAISIARNACNLKQKELAQKLKIQENIIKEYENCSVANFSPQLYKRILKALNVNPKLYI